MRELVCQPLVALKVLSEVVTVTCEVHSGASCEVQPVASLEVGVLVVSEGAAEDKACHQLSSACTG